MAPNIGAGFKYVGFGHFAVFVFEVFFKKWQQDICAIVITGFGGKIDVAELDRKSVV